MKQRLNLIQIILCGLLLTISFNAVSEEFVVGQKDKKFTVASLKIKVGDKVFFKNEDAFFHNVFSLSDVKFFDLGSFPQGEQREVVFDTPGTVEVECAIHPSMKMVIEVE